MYFSCRWALAILVAIAMALCGGRGAAGGGEQAAAEDSASVPGHQALVFADVAKPRGVYQFRDGAMRRNGFSGDPLEGAVEGLTLLWSHPTLAEGEEAVPLPTPNQPLIVKWYKEFRDASEQLFPEKRAKVALKEVISVGADGRLHFIDLEGGQPSRAPWTSGGAFTSMPTVHEHGLPFLFIGEERAGRNGLWVYHTLNGKPVTFLSSGPGESRVSLPPLTVPEYQTRLLCVDRSGLWTAWATEETGLEALFGTPVFLFDTARYESDIREPGEVVHAFAAQGTFAYLADAGGQLQCVHLQSLMPVWVNRLLSVEARHIRLALDPQECGETAVYAVAASQTPSGASFILQRTDGDTGMTRWTAFFAEKDATVWLDTLPSPLVGEGDIRDAVVFAWNREEGGQLVAMEKQTGELLWETDFDAALTASPVAVYHTDGTSFILQGDAAGGLWLLKGFDGTVMESVQLSAAVLDAPAAYSDYVVVPTADGTLHGLRLGGKPEN